MMARHPLALLSRPRLERLTETVDVARLRRKEGVERRDEATPKVDCRFPEDAARERQGQDAPETRRGEGEGGEVNALDVCRVESVTVLRCDPPWIRRIDDGGRDVDEVEAGVRGAEGGELGVEALRHFCASAKVGRVVGVGEGRKCGFNSLFLLANKSSVRREGEQTR